MNNNITLIGAGKLGLGLGLLIEKSGFKVCCVDTNIEYVKKLNEKNLKTFEPLYEELLKNSNNLYATTNLEEGLNYSDTIFILVQTPNTGGERFYDHYILSNLLQNINNFKVKNKDLIVCCTVMPKYIQEVGQYLVSDCENTLVSYNPEFVAQGEIIKGYLNPDIILIGSERPNIEEKLRNIYSKFIKSEPKYLVMSPLEAELVKITVNGYVTTKLSFANMITDVCNNIGANPSIVLNAVGSDSRISNKYFKPGYSFGGPCFPRDTKALKQLVEQSGIESKILEATTSYNQYHIEIYSNKLINYYTKNLDEEIIIEGICYKENSKVPIIEESSKLKIALKLVNYFKNIPRKVVIKDSLELINEVKKEYGNLFEYIIL